MIIDRIPFAGPESYFLKPANPPEINLAGSAVTVRTPLLDKGMQWEISGIQFLMEGADLGPLFSFQVDSSLPPAPSPILSITVIKEMFAGLFADPHRHRVHNIAGHLDFNEGTLVNGRVMEIDGVPTIVSTGRGECSWTSREYELPALIAFSSLAWELAASRGAPPDSFHYRLKIKTKDDSGAQLPDVVIEDNGQPLKANAPRARENLGLTKVKSFQVEFAATVHEDSYLQERHLPLINENLGRPLLRAINLLEPVASVFVIHSLTELRHLCSDFEVFDRPGAAVTRVLATLDLPIQLVSSPSQNMPSLQYEHLALTTAIPNLQRLEARKIGLQKLRILSP